MRQTGTPAISLGEALAEASRVLQSAGIEDPRREARLLAAHAMATAPNRLLDPSTPIDSAAFAALLARRAAHEPMAYITGHRGFWTLDLATTPATLIPRPDSETLIEAAITAIPDRARIHRILDLGTGTGCLLLACLCEFRHAFGIGLDLSPAAAALAHANAARNGLHTRAAFLAADWATPLHATFDLILSNPPYIESAAIPALMPEVAHHEPASALDGGPEGLDAYARITTLLPRLLAPNGIAILELGAGQEPAVIALANQAGLTHITTRPDLAGIPRALVLARAA
jgi:release factor glutamine methyltransferase